MTRKRSRDGLLLISLMTPLLAMTQPVPRPAAPAPRGAEVYSTYCVVCHGAEADGNGRAAALFDPRPANLRKSDKSDDYITRIVRLGGEALGRSSSMPAWGPQLTEAEIADVVAYVRSVNIKKPGR